jgi:hypothetical protein
MDAIVIRRRKSGGVGLAYWRSAMTVLVLAIVAGAKVLLTLVVVVVDIHMVSQHSLFAIGCSWVIFLRHLKGYLLGDILAAIYQCNAREQGRPSIQQAKQLKFCIFFQEWAAKQY